jgi:signal transduction histidine kinase
VSEVRETLYDLRTEVTEEVGLAEALRAFLERVGARSGLDVVVRVQGADRPPLTQERELLRIAQEAVTNVERHARAEHLTVALLLEPSRSALEVADDGRGFDPTAPARADAYGVRGMRERADAIGASLEVTAAPGRGTVVRCALRHDPSPIRLGPRSERMTTR